jgi:hypothetical protein
MIHLHDNGEDRKNLEKRSVRLKAFCKKASSEAYAYHRIFPFGKGNSKKSGDNSYPQGYSVIGVGCVKSVA